MSSAQCNTMKSSFHNLIEWVLYLKVIDFDLFVLTKAINCIDWISKKVVG